MSGTTIIERVEHATPEMVEAFAHLLPLLSTSARSPSLQELDDICHTQCLLVARDRSNGSRIVGSLTLVLFHIPTGLRAWIEDLVVDNTVCGKGIGEALMREAVRIATASRAKSIDLTSRPSRTAAHRLYEKIGFTVRDTSVYRYGEKK